MHHGRVARDGKGVHVRDSGFVKEAAQEGGDLPDDGRAQGIGTVRAGFAPFGLVADAADHVRTVGRLGVVLAAHGDDFPRAQVHQQGRHGGGADVHDEGVGPCRGRVAHQLVAVDEPESAYPAIVAGRAVLRRPPGFRPTFRPRFVPGFVPGFVSTFRRGGFLLPPGFRFGRGKVLPFLFRGGNSLYILIFFHFR